MSQEAKQVPEYYCNQKGCEFHGQDEESENHAKLTGHKLIRFWGEYVCELEVTSSN